uniref:Peptidase C51 domain-containing protein n=1 Tax=Arundo donax TaxID=35708 RepID=A0A0A9GVG7_ARUDO
MQSNGHALWINASINGTSMAGFSRKQCPGSITVYLAGPPEPRWGHVALVAGAARREAPPA